MLTNYLRRGVLALAVSGLVAGAQTPQSAGSDPLQPLHFLEGTWQAHGAAPNGTSADGSYAFRRELGGHVLARHSRTAACKGPSDFDCEHGDLLYVYADAPGQPLKAIYFDSEGHVIHYNVTTPDPNTVMFLSEAGDGGPQFRLMYTLKDGVMSGKFGMRMPGASDWRSYLEWSGPKGS